MTQIQWVTNILQKSFEVRCHSKLTLNFFANFWPPLPYVLCGNISLTPESVTLNLSFNWIQSVSQA